MTKLIKSYCYIFGVLIILFTSVIFSESITVLKLPKSLKEFIDMRNEIATTPQGGALMFVIALNLQVENPAIGKQCLVIAVDNKKLETGNIYKGYQLKKSIKNRILSQLKRFPYIAYSYFKGANPQNGYSTKSPYKIIYSSNKSSGIISGGNYKIFLKSNGADSPRPIRMAKNNRGYWKAVEWSSIIMGIRKPIKINEDKL
jgi:hypothetical protein